MLNVLFPTHIIYICYRINHLTYKYFTLMKQVLQHTKPFQKPPPSSSETETFETLYNRYVDKVYQKCLGMTKDADTAQDFTQDIFIKVFEKLDSFQNRSTFSTWLYSISHNYCLDQIKVGKRLNTDPLANDVAATVAEQDTAASVEFRSQELELVMKSLPAEEITLLRLKYEQGLSIKEIADQYHLKESTVKMRLKRTRDKLQALYNGREHE